MVTLLRHPNMASENDPALMQGVAEGDEDALRALVAAYGQRMYAYALRLSGDPVLADEAVQESLVAVWQGAKRYRGEGRILAWLLGIVHHKTMSALRGRRHLSLNELDDQSPKALAWASAWDPSWEPSSEAAPLDEQAARGEQRQLVRHSLESLSLSHRTVLELVFYQGLSLREAAQVLGVPLGTVKSRLSYARDFLRGELNRAGLKPEDLV